MWTSKLRKLYRDFEEWEAYTLNYGLHTRLGYKSPETAWRYNPKIQGSTNPADFKRVKGGQEMNKKICQVNKIRIFQVSDFPNKFVAVTPDNRHLEEFRFLSDARTFAKNTTNFVKRGKK